MATLLLVTDDAITIKSLKLSLEQQNHSVLVSESIHGARSITSKIDCVICEHRLSDGSGIDLIIHFKPTPLVLLVGQSSLQAGILAMRKGAFDCFTKPVDQVDLVKAVDRATTHYSAITETDSMIGHCESMLKLKRQVSRIAQLDKTILISGESGTGKELVAKSIHAQSKRSGLKMISVNCATIPESLIEVELFGDVNAESSNEVSDYPGLIESADQSSLFLDEIGELPTGTQTRLLQFLEEGKFQRVGGTKRICIDVRLITATRHNLLEMVSTGKFREDLYYRLNIIELICPPLRDRKDDILILAKAFLEQVKKDMFRSEIRFSDAAKAAISKYRWPGNVRELRNVVQRAVFLCEGPIIKTTDLNIQTINTDLPEFSAGEQHRVTESQPTMSLEDYFQHFVLSHQEQMSETELARQLGISRKSLWERRNRLGIPKRKETSSDS
jgi:DNA-binding NtrC family response regulator